MAHSMCSVTITFYLAVASIYHALRKMEKVSAVLSSLAPEGRQSSSPGL